MLERKAALREAGAEVELTRRGGTELVDVVVTLDESTSAAKPTVRSQDNGRYRVEGVMLPKAGSWELAFDVRTGAGEAERLTHDIVLK